MAGWTDDELAVAIILCVVTMRTPGFFIDSGQVLAAVALHGLSRRYERGDDRGDKAVLRDLTVFDRAWPQATRSGGEFEIPAPNGGGKWRGAVMTFDGRPALAITFVNS